MKPAATARWGRVAVLPLRRPGTRPPLFFVSAPDVNALGYVSLARQLDPSESPCSVQARGRGGVQTRDYTPEEYAALAAEYLAAVRARQPVGPYYFAGMCDGAHIAFEMARRLSAKGERVALLAVLDTWPVENSSRYSLVMVEAMRQRLVKLDWRGRFRWLARVVGRRMGRLFAPRAARDALPETHRRWRARVWPGPDFVPPRHDGRITVLRVRKQPYYRLGDPSLGWGARSAEPVSVHVVPGNHHTLLQKPHVAAVARTLATCLAAARAEEDRREDAPRIA